MKNSKLVENLKSRGLLYSVTNKFEEAEKKGFTLYWGIDPTGDSMHVGHLLGVMTARRFLQAGHKIIVLVGGGTSLIGDPSGKNEERPILSKEKIEENKEKLKKIIARLLNVNGGEVRMVDNADWLTKLSLIDFLREVGKFMPMSAMLDKEMVKTRIGSEGGISYAEFSYQLLQAYDYLELFKNFGCNLQIGGSDQWGNIVSGVDLIRKRENAETHAFSFPLIVDPKTGRKFGKSEKGASIWLTADKTHPFALHQFFVNTSDDLAPTLLRYFSLETVEKIELTIAEWNNKKEERLIQKKLATELVGIVHGEEIAVKCDEIAQLLFNKGIEAMDESQADFVAGSLPTITVDIWDENELPKYLVELGLATSKTDASRLIKQAAVKVIEKGVNVRFIKKGRKDYGVVKF